MSKIKLLYAIGNNSGGSLKNVIDIATHLNKEKFEISVVLTKKNQNHETKVAISKLNNCSIDIKYINMSRAVSLMDIIALINIYFYLKKQKFDIIHAHSSKAGALFRIAAFLVKSPIVLYTPHCFYFTAHKGFKRYFYRRMESFLARFSHNIIISGTEQKAINECGINREKVSIIDNAIDISEYKKEYSKIEIREKFNIPENHAVIIGVGRLVEQKNWNMFIDAANIILRKNKNITFIIAGSGPYKNRLLKRITQLGLDSQVKLIGFIEDISKIYAMADIFVSTSKWEGLPYTYIEALYFRIPMVLTYTEGLEYFFKKVHCICVPQENTIFLADKLLDTVSSLSDKSLSNKSSMNTIYPFLLINCIKQYEKLYCNLYRLKTNK
jgi:glycosyltransferase involved in cell wall biosynthesis